MPSPNFFIIGAQKAGSSWLAANLGEHPDVYVAGPEIHYFDKDFNYARGIEWYESHFADAGGASRVGEKTPDYLWAEGQGCEGHMPDVHKKLHGAYPDAQLIVVLRNPVERAVSAVNHIVRSLRISPVHRLDDLLLGRKKHLIEGHGCLEMGMYLDQILEYQKLFPPERFLFLIFEEDILKTPEETMAKVCRFLDIDPDHTFANLNRRINEFNRSFLGLLTDYYTTNGFLRKLSWRVDQARVLPINKKKPSPRALEALYAHYSEANERLFEFLGRRPSSWLAPDAG